MTKIKTYSLSLTEEGFREHEAEYKCWPTKSVYNVERRSNFGGATTKLRPDQILTIDSNVRPDIYNYIQAHIWYFPEQEAEAKKLVYDKVREIAIKQASTAAKMADIINKKTV